MTSFMERIREARELYLARQTTRAPRGGTQPAVEPECRFAQEVGRTSCCGPTYRCTNSESENFGKLGTAHRCARCKDRRPIPERGGDEG